MPHRIIEREVRQVIATTVLSLLRNANRAYFGDGVDLGRTVDLMLILAVVVSRQAEGRRTSANKLSQVLGMPRTTILRKLQRLQELCKIEITEDGVSVPLQELNSHEVLSAVRQNITVLHAMERKLSKMDTVDLDRRLAALYRKHGQMKPKGHPTASVGNNMT